MASAYADIILLVNLDIAKDDPRKVIDDILEVYRIFSLVSRLKIKDT